MSFDFLAWILGYSFSKLTNKLFQKNKLSDILNNTIEKWTSELPNDLYLHPESIFPMESNTDNLSLIELRIILLTNKIPTKNQWYKVLVEQWEIIGNKYNEKSQPFFKIGRKRAILLLEDLSNRLYNDCIENEKLFYHKVVDDLEKITKDISDLLTIKEDFNEIKKNSKDSKKLQNDISKKVDLLDRLNMYLLELNGKWPPQHTFSASIEGAKNIKKYVKDFRDMAKMSYQDMLLVSDQNEVVETLNKTWKLFNSSLDRHLLMQDKFFEGDFARILNLLEDTTNDQSAYYQYKRWLKLIILYKEWLKHQIEMTLKTK